MSCENFFKQNARHFYVYDCRQYYDPATEEFLDEWQEGCEIIDDSDFMGEDITEFGKGYGFVPGKWDSSTIKEAIVSKNFYLEIAGTEVGIQGSIFARPGHYMAANLDWEIYTGESGQRGNYENAEDYARNIVDAALWYSDWNNGLLRMNRDRLVKKVAKVVEGIGREMDDFCRRVCTGVYDLAYQCSNGEAGYIEISRGEFAIA